MSKPSLSSEGINCLKTFIQINFDNTSLRYDLFQEFQKSFPNLTSLKKSKAYVNHIICSNFPLKLYEEHTICQKYHSEELNFVPVNDRGNLEIARRNTNRVKRNRLMQKTYNEIVNLYTEFKLIDSPVKNAKVTYYYIWFAIKVVKLKYFLRVLKLFRLIQ